MVGMTAILRFGDDTLPPERLLPRVRKVAGGLLALGVRDEDVVALNSAAVCRASRRPTPCAPAPATHRPLPVDRAAPCSG